MNDHKLLQESTRAIIHMARTIITIKREIATVAADLAFDDRGILALVEDNCRVLNGLGDILNGMDAVTDEDAWAGEILARLNRRCERKEPST